LWKLQGLLHAHGPAEQVLHGCQQEMSKAAMDHIFPAYIFSASVMSLAFQSTAIAILLKYLKAEHELIAPLYKGLGRK
jgi:hypothetical protein